MVHISAHKGALVTFQIWSCKHDSAGACVCALKTEHAPWHHERGRKSFSAWATYSSRSDTALLTNFISLPELGRCCLEKRKKIQFEGISLDVSHKFVSWTITFQKPRHYGQPGKAANLPDLPRDVHEAGGDLTLSTQPVSEMCQWCISGSETNPCFMMFCGWRAMFNVVMLKLTRLFSHSYDTVLHCTVVETFYFCKAAFTRAFGGKHCHSFSWKECTDCPAIRKTC